MLKPTKTVGYQHSCVPQKKANPTGLETTCGRVKKNKVYFWVTYAFKTHSWQGIHQRAVEIKLYRQVWQTRPQRNKTTYNQKFWFVDKQKFIIQNGPLSMVNGTIHLCGAL